LKTANCYQPATVAIPPAFKHEPFSLSRGKWYGPLDPQLARSEKLLNKECGWKDGDSGGSARRNHGKKNKNRLDTNRPSHGRHVD
jgi:hypothetical protein